MRILYLHCFSGISGDMTLAALADAGADRDAIESELHKIKLEPYRMEWKKVTKCGIAALKLDVVPETPAAAHRHYSDIVGLIRAAGLSERATDWSLKIFEKIGKAEAKIHNTPLEKVHFHEVGAVDSIVDIVGTAIALDLLEIEQIHVSPVPLGSGSIRCDHGLYPVPAPATLEMMKGLPIAHTTLPFELTTPTGAAIVSATADAFADGLPPMTVEAIGYGAGTRDLPEQPNVLRAVIGVMASDEISLGHMHFHPHDHHDHHNHHEHHDHEHHNHGHHDHDHHNHDHHDHHEHHDHDHHDRHDHHDHHDPDDKHPHHH